MYSTTMWYCKTKMTSVLNTCFYKKVGKHHRVSETTSEMFQVFIVLEASYFDLTASKTEPKKKNHT
jgi:hypothetical protein